MTLTLNKTHTADVFSKTTAQDHHLKAAQHLDHASKSHKEAARLIEGGDHHAASSQAKLAAEHTAHAAHQVNEAGKKSANQPVVRKMRQFGRGFATPVAVPDAGAAMPSALASPR